jgi:Ni2+-binding GTPase involved in maturation of urease and hydrogenase
MRLITVAGPPSVGKTSLFLKVAARLRDDGAQVGVAKFDALSTTDDAAYAALGLPVRVGLSGGLCPDHYFVSNIDDCVAWGRRSRFDVLIVETAGLCNRCSPHIKGVLAICVVDNLAGIHTPRKIGPMLRLADVVAITKGDIVSQAEREVFNGITGQGAMDLAFRIDAAPRIDALEHHHLRFSMPSAVCTYCVGETAIGETYQRGNVRKMSFEDSP